MARTGAEYIDYYRKLVARNYYRTASQGGLGQGERQVLARLNDPNAVGAEAARLAKETALRRRGLAAEQGEFTGSVLGALGSGDVKDLDLTDTVVQDAAAKERRRRTVGRTGASTFLSSKQSLLAGAL